MLDGHLRSIMRSHLTSGPSQWVLLHEVLRRMYSIGRLVTLLPSVHMRILICDDEDALLRFLGRILRGAGYDVVEAHDGREVVQILQSHPCDLVLIDIFMERQEGIETIRTLRQRWPALTIIAMSGGGCHGDIDVLTDARAFGADHTLTKPFRPTDLLRLVGEVRSKDVEMTDASTSRHTTGLARASGAEEDLLRKNKSARITLPDHDYPRD